MHDFEERDPDPGDLGQISVSGNLPIGSDFAAHDVLPPAFFRLPLHVDNAKRCFIFSSSVVQ